MPSSFMPCFPIEDTVLVLGFTYIAKQKLVLNHMTSKPNLAREFKSLITHASKQIRGPEVV